MKERNNVAGHKDGFVFIGFSGQANICNAGIYTIGDERAVTGIKIDQQRQRPAALLLWSCGFLKFGVKVNATTGTYFHHSFPVGEAFLDYNNTMFAFRNLNVRWRVADDMRRCQVAQGSAPCAESNQPVSFARGHEIAVSYPVSPLTDTGFVARNLFQHHCAASRSAVPVASSTCVDDTGGAGAAIPVGSNQLGLIALHASIFASGSVYDACVW